MACEAEEQAKDQKLTEAAEAEVEAQDAEAVAAQKRLIANTKAGEAMFAYFAWQLCLNPP